MKNFEDEEYFLLKALSSQIVSGLSAALEKVTKQCENLIIFIEDIDLIQFDYRLFAFEML